MSSEAVAGAGSVWNAGSWHWEEKNYTPWAHEYIKHMLLGTVVENMDCTAAVVDVTELKGDAAVNIRKGKKVTLFELNIRAKWEGSVKDGSSDASKVRRGKMTKGTLEVLELFQDDVDDDFEVRISLDSSSSGPSDRKVYELMRDRGANAVREGIREFARQLRDRDGGEDAIKADAERRETEAEKKAEAEKLKAADKARLEAEAAAREAARKEEEAKRAATMPKKIEAGPARVEGTGSEWNKGSYHWEEKPAGPWARERLTEMLKAWSMEVPSGTLKITDATVTGDASVTIRKGKKIIFFELKVVGEWEGELLDGSGTVISTADGEFEVPDVDQETVEDGDFEVRVTAKGTLDRGAERIKEHMRKAGAAEVKKIVERLWAELQAR